MRVRIARTAVDAIEKPGDRAKGGALSRLVAAEDEVKSACRSPEIERHVREGAVRDEAQLDEPHAEGSPREPKASPLRPPRRRGTSICSTSSRTPRSSLGSSKRIGSTPSL